MAYRSNFRRKIVQVSRNNDLCSGLYSSGQDVAIVGIRQLEPSDKPFVPGHNAVGDGLGHELAGA